MKTKWNPVVLLFGVATVTAIVLSFIWQVAYIYTLIGFAAWVFAGHLVTIDDDLPGGWSNPDGSQPSTWLELSIKAAVLLVLIILATLVPGLRDLGAG